MLLYLIYIFIYLYIIRHSTFVQYLNAIRPACINYSYSRPTEIAHFLGFNPHIYQEILWSKIKEISQYNKKYQSQKYRIISLFPSLNFNVVLIILKLIPFPIKIQCLLVYTIVDFWQTKPIQIYTPTISQYEHSLKFTIDVFQT